MPEEKKSGITIDAADIAKETLDSLSNFVQVAEKHPRGSLFSLALIGVISATAIALMYLRQPRVTTEEKAAPAEKKDAIKQVDGEEFGDKIFEIKN